MLIDIPIEIIEKTGAIERARKKWEKDLLGNDIIGSWEKLGQNQKSYMVSKELKIENIELNDEKMGIVKGVLILNKGK